MLENVIRHLTERFEVVKCDKLEADFWITRCGLNGMVSDEKIAFHSSHTEDRSVFCFTYGGGGEMDVMVVMDRDTDVTDRMQAAKSIRESLKQFAKENGASFKMVDEGPRHRNDPFPQN